MSSAQTAIEAIRKSLVVNCSPERAFEVFTEIGSWWPVHTHSISVMDDGTEPPETAVMEPGVGGRLYERTRDGKELSWGKVLAWEPPSRLVIEWKVNPDAVAPTEIEVRFAPEGDGTRVELEHRGWERLGEAALESRTSYEGGWNGVLAGYEAAANA